MKTKKGEVFFCIGLIIVLINAVSSELLTDAFAISFLPYYPDTEDEGGVGQRLQPVPINPDTEFSLFMYVDNWGNDIIRRIRFQAVSSGKADPELKSKLWNGVPGIEVFPRGGDQGILHKCIFDGIEIAIEPISGTLHSLMKLNLKFYDEEFKRLLSFKVMMIEKPTTQKDLRKAKDFGLYDCPTFKSFDEIMSRKQRDRIPVVLKEDFPWIPNVLDRAKHLGRPMFGDFPNNEWYYAGGIMVQPGIIPSILRLDPRWAHHIPKESDTGSSTKTNKKSRNAILSCLGVNDTE